MIWSCVTLSLRSRMATQTTTTPTMTTSASMTRMRALPRWSAYSLVNTAPVPVNGEPSRRILLSLEVAVVDRLEAGTGGPDLPQAAAIARAGGDDLGGDVAIRAHHQATALRGRL